MHKILIGCLLALLAVNAFSATLKPAHVFSIKANVTGFALEGKTLYVMSEEGAIDLFDLETNRPLKTITIPSIENFTGDTIPPKIFSIDVLNGAVLIACEGNRGARALHIIEGDRVTPVFEQLGRRAIKRALFVEPNLILVGLLSNEFLLMDRQQNSKVYEVRFEPSAFSDLLLNRSRTVAASSSESGKVNLFDARTGKIRTVLDGANKDNVYKIGFASGYVVTGGQDRNVGIYRLEFDTHKVIKAEFLVYAVGLGPIAKTFAYQMNEHNDISVRHTRSGDELHVLKGHNSTVNQIRYLDSDTLVSSSDDKHIILWRLP